VIETKVNSTTRLLRSNTPVTSLLITFIDILNESSLSEISINYTPTEFDKYFKRDNLLTLLKLKKYTEAFFKCLFEKVAIQHILEFQINPMHHKTHC